MIKGKSKAGRSIFKIIRFGLISLAILWIYLIIPMSDRVYLGIWSGLKEGDPAWFYTRSADVVVGIFCLIPVLLITVAAILPNAIVGPEDLNDD
jgi:O-antigen/teichoic acid export membrane protein